MLLAEPVRGPRWFLALGAVAVALALAKPTYVVVTLLVFLVPFGRLGLNRFRAASLKTAVFALALGVSALWDLAVRSVSLAAYFPPGVIEPRKQASFILHDPPGGSCGWSGIPYPTSLRSEDGCTA
jgi:hypothetical protein